MSILKSCPSPVHFLGAALVARARLCLLVLFSLGLSATAAHAVHEVQGFSLTGTPIQGGTLTVTGTNLTSGHPGEIPVYSWRYFTGAPLSETSNTYQLTQADVGRFLIVSVSTGDQTRSLGTLDEIVNSNLRPTGTVPITGNLSENETLGVNLSGLRDDDGLPNRSTFSYQWSRSDAGTNLVPISGATGRTYTLTQSDVGNHITLTISYTDRENRQETYRTTTSGQIANVNVPPTGLPAISGTRTEGRTLTAITDAIEDRDGLENAVFTYQWNTRIGSTDTPISGATQRTYIPTQADVGRMVTVTVRYTDDENSAEGPLTSAPTTVFAQQQTTRALSATVTPLSITPGDGPVEMFPDLTVIGTIPNLVQIRVLNRGDLVNEDAVTTPFVRLHDPVVPGFNFQASPTNITSDSRVFTSFAQEPPSQNAVAWQTLLRSVAFQAPADTGGRKIQLRVEVSYDNGSSYFNMLSRTLNIVGPAPNNPPTSSGLAVTTNEDIAYTFEADDFPFTDADTGDRLQRVSINDLPARGTLTLGGGAVLAGQVINVTAIPTLVYTPPENANGDDIFTYSVYDGTTFSTATTMATITINPVNDPPTGAVTIDGMPAQNQTLTAVTDAIVEPDGLENAVFTYQWNTRVGSTDTPISNATSETYTLTQGDVGEMITVTVRYTDAGGEDEGPLTSAPTEAVANVNDPPVGTAITLPVPSVTGGAETVDLNSIFTDPDGDALIYTASSGDESVLRVSVTDSTLTLIPVTRGTATLTLRANDRNGGNGELRIVATVGNSPPIIPEIVLPVFTSFSGEQGPFDLSDIPRGVDPDGDITTYTVVSDDLNIAEGMIDASHPLYRLFVTPFDIGNANLTITANDGNGGTDTRVVAVQVLGFNRSPVRTMVVPMVPELSLPAGPQEVELSGTYTDPDGDDDALTYQAVFFDTEDPNPDFEEEDVVTWAVTGSTLTLTPVGPGTLRLGIRALDSRLPPGRAGGLILPVTVINSPVSGNVIIDGVPERDQTLTADTSGISDADGPDPLPFTYQWNRNNGTTSEPIPGANEETYTLTDDDVGNSISVTVDYTDRGGTDEGPLTSTLTAQVIGTVAVSIAPPDAPVDEGEDATFTVTLSHSTANDIVLNYATSVAPEDTAEQSDFMAMSGTLTFSPGAALSQTFTVSVEDDELVEGDETFTATLSANSASPLPVGVSLATATAQATIAANGTATVSVINDGSAVPEDQEDITFVVQLSGAPGSDVVVNYTASVEAGDTAMASDFTETTGTLTFPAGTSELSQTFTVGVVNDNLPEDNETFTVTLSENPDNPLPAGFTLDMDMQTARGTIAASDEATISLAGPRDPVIEGENAVFTVTLSASPVGDGLTVGFSTSIESDDTAQANDFTATSGAQTFFTGTNSLTQTIVVPVTDDNEVENSETFTLTLMNDGDGGSVFPPGFILNPSASSAKATITGSAGSNTPPTTSAAAVSTPEDMAYTFEADDFPFSDTDSGDSLQEVRIDSLPTPASLGALALNNTAVIVGQVIAVGDIGTLVYTPATNANGAATFTFSVSDGTDFSTTPATATITVNAVNDDPSGTVTISGTPQVGQTLMANTTSITDADGPDMLSFTYQWLAGGIPISNATSPTYLLTGDELGAMISVDISYMDANDIEGGVVSDPVGPVIAAGTVTVSIAPPGAAVDEGDPATFTVTLSGSPTDEVVVNYATSLASGDTALANDFTETNGTLTFAAGATSDGLSQTFSVPTTDDSDTEGDETFTLTLSANTASPLPAGVTLGTATTKATIAASDAATNSPPTTGDLMVMTNEDTDYTFASANFPFADTDGDTLAAVRIDSLPASTSGSLALNGTAVIVAQVIPVASIPNLVYTPVTNVNGDATFTFSVSDGTVFSTPPATATITVNAVNDAPSGTVTITGTTTQGETLTADTSGITDADGPDPLPFTYQWNTHASGANTAIDSATAATYLLTADDVGDQITVSVRYTDAGNTPESLTSAPTAFVAAPGNIPATGEPTISGILQVGQTLTADTSAITDANGPAVPAFSYQWQADGQDIAGATAITYIPTAGDVGDMITVTAIFTDDGGTREERTSAPTAVIETNTRPTARASVDQGVADKGSLITLDGSGSDDPDGDNANLTYLWEQQPGSTMVTLSDPTAQQPTFTIPTLIASGFTFRFRLVVSDGALSSTNTAEVSIFTRPIFQFPTTLDNQTYVVGNQIGDLTLPTALDIAGSPNTYALSPLPPGLSFNTTNRTLSGTPSQAGTFDLTYVATSSIGTDSRSFTITVTNNPPTTSGLTVATNEDTDYTFAAGNFNFADTNTGDMLEQVRIDTLPASTSGSLALNGTPVIAGQVIAVADIPNLVYTPLTNVNGAATFTFSVSDGTDFSAMPATATVSVTAVNDPPTITGLPNTTVLQGVAYSFTPGGGDVDGDTLEYAITNPPSWASFDETTGALTGTPASTDVGTTTDIIISVTDNIITTPVALSAFNLEVTATATNMPPTADAGANQRADKGTTVTLNGTASNDPDGDNSALVYLWERTAGPTVTLSNIAAPQPTFTIPTLIPASGPDSFTFSLVVNDGQVSSTAATVTIFIRPLFQAAIANQTYTAGTAITALTLPEALAGPDSLPSTNTYALAPLPAGLSFNATSRMLTGTPTTAGTSNLTYTATNADGDTDSLSFSIAVASAPNTPPTTSGLTASTNEDTAYNFAAANFNFADTDMDDSLAAVRIDSLPASGSGNLALGGAAVTAMDVIPVADIPNLIYTPATNVNGDATFTFSVSDGTDFSTPPATATLTVTPVNDAPTAMIASDPSTRAGKGSTVTVDGRSSTDPDGDMLRYLWTHTGGTPVTFSDPTAAMTTYTVPDVLEMNASPAVSLEVDDGNGGTDTATRTVFVRPLFQNTIADQTYSAGNAITDLRLPESTSFEGTTYTYTLSSVPAGLSFDASSRTLTGTPTQVGSFDLVYTATTPSTSTSGGSDTDSLSFMIIVTNTPATGAPTITGTPTEGRVLTAVTDAIGDANGPGTFSYQWNRNDGTTDTPISGANMSTYTLTAGDVGERITLTVSFTDAGNTPESLTSAPTAAVAAISTNNPPTTSGLTVSTNEDTAYPFTAANFNFADTDSGDTLQQVRIDTLPASTSGSLTLGGAVVNVAQVIAVADIPTLVYIPVTNVNGDATFTFSVSDGTDFSAPPATATITVNSVNDDTSGTVTITGTATVGQTLTANTDSISDADGPDTLTFSYQWIAGLTPISGATSATYTLTDAELGEMISVDVSYTDAESIVGGAVSEFVGPVAAPGNIPATGEPTISGILQVGQTLTADTSAITDANGPAAPAFSYQWQADGQDIAGATAITYIPTAGDVGDMITVTAIFTDDGGTREERTSAPTAVIETNTRPTARASVDQGVAAKGSLITLDGSGSDDPDGDNANLTYLWEQQPGSTPVTLSDPTAQQPTFTIPTLIESGFTFVFRLVVSDGALSSTNTAEVTIFTRPIFQFPTTLVDQTYVVGNQIDDLILPTALDIAGSPNTYALSPLPPGLSFNTTNRTLSGTPSQAGTFDLTYVATSSIGTDSRSFSIAVVDPVTVSIAPPGAAVDEGDPATFAVTLSASPGSEVVVNYATSIAMDDTVVAADFTETTGTLTFAAGATDLTQTFTVSVSNDNIVEGDETFTATLSANSASPLPAGVTLGTTSAQATIAAAGMATVSISGGGNVVEGESTTFSVTLSASPGSELLVDYASSPDTAVAADFTETSGTLTFAADTTTLTQDISVPTTDDSVAEGDETFTMTLSANATSSLPTGFSLDTTTATATIVATGTVTVSIAPPGAAVDEGDPATFTVTLSGSPGSEVVVNYATSIAMDDTAAADFTDTSGTLTFAANATSDDLSQTFDVPVSTDSFVEGDETFTATLSANSASPLPAGVTLGTTSAQATIAAAGMATVSIEGPDTPVAEGGSATFTVTLSGSPGSEVVVNYASSPDTAVAADFTETTGTLTFAANASGADLTQDISVPTTDDSDTEGVETFTLTLSAPGGGFPTGVTLNPSATSAQATIAASDAPVNNPPTTSGLAVTTNEDTDHTFAASNFNFADTDTGDMLEQVRIDTLPVSASGSLALNGTPVNAMQVIAVADIPTLVYTPVANVNGAATFTFSVSDGTAFSAPPATATITVNSVNDDPSGTVTISGTPQVGQTLMANTAGISDADGPATLSFTYQWLAGSTLISNSDSPTYLLTGDELGAMISVDVSYMDADGFEGGVVSDPVGPVIAAGTVTVSIAPPGAAVDEGDPATFTVTLSGSPGSEVVVNYASSPDTAVAADFTETSGTLTFAANASGADLTQDISVPTTDDSDTEGVETFTLTLSAPGGGFPTGVTLNPSATSAQATIAASDAPVNNPPTTSGLAVTTNEDTDHTFAASNFNFTDTDTGDMLEQVRIDTLPASTSGSLALNGAAVTAMQVIAVADIPTLVYTPVTNVNGDATFTFSVSDGTAFSAPPATATITVNSVNDDPSGTVTISGTPQVGQTLMANTAGISDADGPATLSFTYQWLAGSTLISNSDSPTYLLTGDELGAMIGVDVSYMDADGFEGGVVSDPVGPVIAAGTVTVSIAPPSAAVDEGDPATFTVTLSGSPTDEVVVNYATSIASDDTAVAADFTETSGTLTFAAGATSDGLSQTFSVPTTDDSDTEGVETFTATLSANTASPLPAGVTLNPSATSAQATIAASDAPVNNPPTGLPTIDGMTIAGQTLTADTSGITDADGPDPLPFTYQWLANDGTTNEEINGATSPTYLLTGNELGEMITVSVRYTDAGNTAEGPLTSDPVGPVVAAQLEVLDEEDEVAALGVALASTDSAGTTITLPTSEPVDVSMARTDEFRVTSTLDDDEIMHTVDSISAGSIILMVSPAIPAGADIVVFYAPVQGSITGTITSTRLAEFSGNLSVINNVVNRAPTADAGDNQTVAEGATVTLNGSASSDSEGEDLTYAWTQSSGTNVTLNDASAESPTFTAPANLSANAVLEFTLTVNDGTSDSTPDPVRISVTTDAPARQQALKTGLAALGRGLAASATDAIGQRLKPAATRPETSAFSGLSLANCIANMTSLTPTDTASADGADRSAWFDPRGLGGDIGSAEPDNDSRNPLGACRLPDSGQLARSAFVIPLNRLSGKGNTGAGGGIWSLWGRGDLSRFEGRPQTGLDLDGDLRAGYLGLDYRLSSGGLVGVALSRSEGEIDIGTADDTLDKGTLDKGTLDTRLNSVYPYGYWSPRAGMGLWGLLGVGSGDATLSHRETDFATDLDMRMGALGLRQVVQTLGSFELALKADAFVVELESEDVPGLPAVSARARRARLLLEASHSWQLQPDERLGTSLELGARADGGDADEGAGAELGVGLEYSNTRLGLRAQWRAQGLLAHSASGFEEWGTSLNVELDPGVSGRGLALTLAPTWGQAASGGAQALWQSDRPLRDSGLAQASAMRMDLDLSYGLNRDRKQLSPFASLGLADGVMQRLRLGLRLRLADELEMELFGGRNASENRSPEHLLGLTGRLRF